ncbi:MAG: hypothetical protein ACE37J_21855 [Pikeienuella sp.]|uniref:hypothetical protein n=1 Tax=Pikeienuella sp. TaxID=2831957 RepID=UPI003919896E
MRRQLLFAATAAALAAPASAETASTTLDVTVSLQPALTVTCDPADFGVLKLATGNRGGVTRVQLLSDGTRIFFGAANGVSFGAAGASGPSCTMEGSAAGDGETASISMDIGTGSMSGDAVGQIAAPSAAAAVKVFGTTTANATVASGSATFDALAVTIEVPNNLTADNYGGYAGTIEVAVDDGVGG